MLFADDLFILSAATIEFLQLIKQCMENFASGLKPNLLKSSMFIAGLIDEEKQVPVEFMGMEIQNLPDRYLGVPLISTK